MVIDTVPVGKAPTGVGVSPDGKKVYVENITDNNISVIGTATDRVTATVAVGTYPEDLAFANIPSPPQPPSPVCGNSMVETGEECDPPNGTTCSSSCKKVTPPTQPPRPRPVCGNGTIEGSEQCDPPDGETCSSSCKIKKPPFDKCIRKPWLCEGEGR